MFFVSIGRVLLLRKLVSILAERISKSKGFETKSSAPDFRTSILDCLSDLAEITMMGVWFV